MAVKDHGKSGAQEDVPLWAKYNTGKRTCLKILVDSRINLNEPPFLSKLLDLICRAKFNRLKLRQGFASKVTRSNVVCCWFFHHWNLLSSVSSSCSLAYILRMFLSEFDGSCGKLIPS